jgi:leader peptidase (prepilin peptidase)/N-methyltransferase
MIDKLSFTNLTILFIVGIIFGSFLNVVIYRIPKSISIIKPSSFCPTCFNQLKWFENIPLLSYIILLGKCSHCKSNISIQYPLIELVNGFMIIGLLYFSNTIFQYIAFSVLSMTLLCLIVIDFKNYIIPDVLIIVSSVTTLIYFGFYEQFELVIRFYYSLLTGIGMYILRLITTKLYKKETFGLGDIKLSALIGFIIGSWSAYIAIFFGFILAAIIFTFLISFRIHNKNEYLPLGPYLVFGMVIYLLNEEKILFDAKILDIVNQ